MRVNRPVSLAISAALHLAVFGGGMLSWAWFGKPVPVEVTPVTLMTAAEVARLMAADYSEAPEQAAVEEPDLAAEPLPAAPAPAPTPAPAPAPTAPAPRPAPKAPTAPAPAPALKTGPVNLDSLAASLATASPRAGGAPKAAAAAKGPARVETDLAAREAEGLARATSQTALNALVDKLTRTWKPNCTVANPPNVTLRLQLAQDGTLREASLPDYGNATSADRVPDPAVRTAAQRALSAAAAGSPYYGLPRDDYNYWRNVRVVFDGRKACALF